MCPHENSVTKTLQYKLHQYLPSRKYLNSSSTPTLHNKVAQKPLQALSFSSTGRPHNPKCAQMHGSKYSEDRDQAVTKNAPRSQDASSITCFLRAYKSLIYTLCVNMHEKNKLHNAYHHSSTFLCYRRSREAEGIITGSLEVPLRSGVLVASDKYR